MILRALIFDVDGTLADTEEVHRRSFNTAFQRAGLDWAWSREAYRELLKINGGKERIASHIDSLVLRDSERNALRAPVGNAMKKFPLKKFCSLPFSVRAAAITGATRSSS